MTKRRPSHWRGRAEDYDVKNESWSCPRNFDSNPKFFPGHGAQGTEGNRTFLRTGSAHLTLDLGWEVGAGNEPQIRSETQGREVLCAVIVPDLNLSLVCAPPRRGSVGVQCAEAESKNAHSSCGVGSRRPLVRRLGSLGTSELAASLAWRGLS